MSRSGEEVKIFERIAAICRGTLLIWIFLVVVFFLGPGELKRIFSFGSPVEFSKKNPIDDYWRAPDTTSIPPDETGALVRYGRELIVHTSVYLGPQGKINRISNGMNCQNCHLEAGTKPFGNNYSAVASTYPKWRARSGTKETIEKRVSDCLERSLNGIALKTDSREMKAIVAYIKWLGAGVPKDKVPDGAGLVDLTFLQRPANPEKGKILYANTCAVCHGKSGEGLKNNQGNGWTYPPLWGKQSYNTGAGLYRLSRFAGYIKANMPFGASVTSPLLTDEEAWDIAAFVNTQPRPVKNVPGDWPDISKKPFDHPFGPFADTFKEEQHKLGPFMPIIEAK